MHVMLELLTVMYLKIYIKIYINVYINVYNVTIKIVITKVLRDTDDKTHKIYYNDHNITTIIESKTKSNLKIMSWLIQIIFITLYITWFD